MRRSPVLPAVFCLLVLLLTLVAPMATVTPVLAQEGGGEEPPAEGGDAVPGQMIIRFKAEVTPEQVSDFYAQYGLAEKANLDHNATDRDPGQRLVAVQAEVKPSFIELLAADERIAYAEPNYLIHVDKAPNDPDYSKLWGLNNTGQTGGTNNADINAPEAWEVNTGSADVIVGVIDTGIDPKHEDLAKNMWVNPGECPGGTCNANGKDDDNNGYVDDFNGINTIDDSNNIMDDYGHGTHVAGTIGAVGDNSLGVVGVNWKVKLIACKFLGASGSGTVAGAVKCFNYFRDLKTKYKQNVVLTNNSWGASVFSQALYDSMAGPDQPLHVCAAGNSNTDRPHYPSGFDLEHVISVAATDHNDNYASFSNYGTPHVDLAAPGVDIYSTVPTGDCPICDPSGYTAISGTSMATPHVAGVAALLWAQYPKLTREQIKGRLLSAVDPLKDRSKLTLTNGRLNVLNTMENDIIPPATVTNLSVAGVLMTRVKLTWTATGDDGMTGLANSYDIRYSPTPISDANWDRATPATAVPSPQKPGTTESFAVTNLEPGKTYYFALKVLDNAGNSSELSNVVVGKTSGGTIVFADDMESGPTKWTPAGKDSLWHLSTLRSNSPNNAWYYGKEDKRNYDTGGINSGTLTSQAINLVGADDAMLTFYEWSQVQTNARLDRTRVQISSDGQAWTTIHESHGTQDAWVKQTVDLTPYISATATVQLRFWFDTVDNSSNQFEGWYVDDVQVVTAQEELPGEEKPTANLAIPEGNLLFDPNNPAAGSSVRLHVTVINNGSAEANDVLVQFMDTTSGTAIPIGQPQLITNIPVGGSGMAQVTYETGGNVGNRGIQVVADPNNYIPELNEADNSTLRILTVAAAAAPNLQVRAANIGFEPPTLDPGDQVTIRATVFNTGTVEARDVVVQFADVTGTGSTTIGEPQTIDVIAPGGSAAVEITYDTAGLTGDRDIEVRVDPNNAILESNEGDNKVEKTIKMTPKLAPNLNIQAANIGFTPPEPTAGQVMTIYATVLNDGNAAVEGVLVQVMDVTNAAASVPIGEPQTIASLAVGGSATVQVAYDTSDKVGDRKIEVNVDPNNFVNELRESDNKAQKTIKVNATTAANLVINAANINFSPAAPVEGDQVTILATVLNNGAVDATNVVVQFLDANNGGGLPIGGGDQGTQTIPLIPAGGSGLAQVTFDSTDKAGDRSIQVLVDPNNAIQETDETDNQARDGLRILQSDLPNLLLVANNVEFYPPQPTASENITINVVVLNNGVTDANRVLVQVIDLTTGSAVPIGPEQFIDVVPAGSSASTFVTFNAQGLVKDRKLQVLVDSNNLIEESNESDNTISKLLPIGAAAAPNLVMLAQNIGFSPPDPTEGEQVTISAVVLNTGAADASDVIVQFVDYSTGRPIPIGNEQVIASIPVGGSGVAQVIMATTTQPGDHQIRVSVDPGNVIAESDETDNRNSALLTVSSPAAANLFIPASNIGFNAPNPVEGEAVSVTVTILNVGAIDAHDVLVQFVDVTDGGFVPIGAKQTIATIAPGREAKAQVTYDTKGKAGERKIYAVADPHTIIPETNEADNNATQTLSVLPQPMPNLVVAESNIGFSPSLPNAGEQVTIHATIVNNGQTDAANVTVQVLDTTNNGATPVGATQTISLIPAGSSGAVIVTYDTTDKPGDRKLQVIADRNNLIEETSETDNTARKTLKVTPPALANLSIQAGNIGFDPAAPEPGAQVTLFATVINDGNVAATNVAVQFFDATTTGSLIPIGQVQTIALIPAGGSGAAQVVYDTAGLSGDRKIQVTVDPNNFIPEVKKSDNTVQKSLLLAAAATPNLAVSASSIGFAATQPTAGELVNLVVTVLNDGGAPARDVVVQFMDATDATTLPIGQPQTVDVIPVGGSGVAQVAYDTTNHPGLRKISVVVDPNNFISERSETDNSATTTLKVNAVAAPNLVVQASNLGFNPPNPLEGNAVTVQVAVLNNGGADASDVIVQFVDVTDGGAIPIDAPQSITTIPAGSSGAAQVSYPTGGKVGPRKIQAIADPNNYIPESDENDNRATDTLQVDPPLAANLKVLPGNLKFDPPAPEQGDLVTITLTILNDGNATANDVVVQLTDVSGGGVKPIGVEQTIESIPPGGSVPLYVRYDATDEPGDREIQVVVDPNDLIRESDESDNRISKNLAVTPPIIPNIVVLPTNITFAPATPIEGDPVTITVNILNNGTGAVTDLLVQIMDNTDGTGEIIGGPQTIPTLAAGGSAELKVIMKETLGKVGERRIQVVADPANAIEETNERDNEATKALRILSQSEKPEPQPNLVIKAESIGIISSTVPAGTPVTVTVTVSNTGDGNAKDVIVELTDISNGASEVIGRAMLTGTMVAGRAGRTRLIFDTTGKAVGKHELQIMADPDNAITESDETDNQASKPLTLTTASAAGGLTETAPPVAATSEEPNLVVQTDNIRYFTPAASNGSTPPQLLTLEVTVVNSGAEVARNVGVEFIAMTKNGWSPLGGAQVIEAIPAQGAGTAQVTYDLNQLAGAVEVRVLVDPQNAILEADEADNRASRLLSLDMVAVEKKP